jgi:hypothetical protein
VVIKLYDISPAPEFPRSCLDVQLIESSSDVSSSSPHRGLLEDSSCSGIFVSTIGELLAVIFELERLFVGSVS